MVFSMGQLIFFLTLLLFVMWYKRMAQLAQQEVNNGDNYEDICDCQCTLSCSYTT